MKNCKIIQDLLPNYIENLTSEETNTFIEEHLTECDNCKKIYESMKKDYKVENEKRDGREVEYIKKYNKKMKVWKKFLLIALGIFAVYACSVIYKLIILSNIDRQNIISNNKENYYYYSISNDTLTEYFKKDGIIKMHVRQAKGNGDITFWKDSKTGEQLIFWNKEKLYDKAEGGILESLPTSMFTAIEPTVRIMTAAHPFVFIGSQTYNEIQCYNIRFNSVYEVIGKDTGLVLYSNEDNYIRNVQYKFNAVTDEDVAKPDLSQYKLNKK